MSNRQDSDQASDPALVLHVYREAPEAVGPFQPVAITLAGRPHPDSLQPLFAHCHQHLMVMTLKTAISLIKSTSKALSLHTKPIWDIGDTKIFFLSFIHLIKACVGSFCRCASCSALKGTDEGDSVPPLRSTGEMRIYNALFLLFFFFKILFIGC